MHRIKTGKGKKKREMKGRTVRHGQFEKSVLPNGHEGRQHELTRNPAAAKYPERQINIPRKGRTQEEGIKRDSLTSLE